MKNKFVDHLFSNILEGRNDAKLSAMATKAKLKQLDEIGDKIRDNDGEEARDNVLSYKEVKRALEQCLEYIENNSSPLSDVDFTIYYSFASYELKKVEATIDAELPDYNF